jgi:hypothetical protein
LSLPALLTELAGAAVKNASALSIPGPRLLWPEGRKWDDGIVGGRPAIEGVDKSLIVSVVEGRPVEEGKTLGAWEPSSTLPRGKPGDDGEPSNAGTFRDEALESEP